MVRGLDCEEPIKMTDEHSKEQLRWISFEDDLGARINVRAIGIMNITSFPCSDSKNCPVAIHYIISCPNPTGVTRETALRVSKELGLDPSWLPEDVRAKTKGVN